MSRASSLPGVHDRPGGAIIDPYRKPFSVEAASNPS